MARQHISRSADMLDIVADLIGYGNIRVILNLSPESKLHQLQVQIRQILEACIRGRENLHYALLIIEYIGRRI